MKPINLIMLITISFVTIFALATTSSFASNVKHGKKLYTEKCGGCHGTRIHNRPNRIVHTYEDLVNRVRFCDNAAKAGLKDNEIYDVSDYLNEEFYKFIKTDS